MAFSDKCVKCGHPFLGLPIRHKGVITWDVINRMLMASGAIVNPMPKPPLADLFYAVIVDCPQCTRRQGDFLIATTADLTSLLVWHSKKLRYEAETELRKDMLTHGNDPSQITVVGRGW